MLLGMLVMFATSVGAAVVAHVEILDCGDSYYSYRPPVGKVFIVEHVMFNDAWLNSELTMAVELIPEGSGENSEWMSSMQFSTTWNTLPRPIRLPRSVTIAVNILEDIPFNADYKCYLFGLLVDEADLYASVPSEIMEFERASASSLAGSIALASPRSSVVKMESSSDLVDWQPAANVTIKQESSPHQREFTVDTSGQPGDGRTFFRAKARARSSEGAVVTKASPPK